MSTRRGFPEPLPPEKDKAEPSGQFRGKVPTPTGKIRLLTNSPKFSN